MSTRKEKRGSIIWIIIFNSTRHQKGRSFPKVEQQQRQATKAVMDEMKDRPWIWLKDRLHGEVIWLRPSSSHHHGCNLLFREEGGELGRTHLYRFGYKHVIFGYLGVNSSDSIWRTCTIPYNILLDIPRQVSVIHNTSRFAG